MKKVDVNILIISEKVDKSGYIEGVVFDFKWKYEECCFRKGNIWIVLNDE